MRLVFDIEASGLLTDETIDYTASPYVLKDHYKFHCLVIKNIDTGEVLEYDPDTFKDGVEYIKANATTLIGHNIVDYDLLALKLGFDFDYTVYPDTICGRPCTIIDTLVLSKTLNPDRMFHSLDYLGKLAGVDKIDWRGKAVELGLIDSHAPKGEEFKAYHPAMLEYNRQDVEVNHKVYDVLMKEWGTWNWQPAFELEMAVRDIVTKGSHRGMFFNRDKAESNIRELDALMRDLESTVEPVLPPKEVSATELKKLTPTTKQFNMNGSPNTHITNFCNKYGSLEEVDGEWIFHYEGKDLKLPLPIVPLYRTVPSDLKDTTHIKAWLVGMGWQPTDYKERDLTLDSKKKKITKEKYLVALDKYLLQTFGSAFEHDRLEHLTDYLRCSSSKVTEKMKAHDISKPMKVLTNPVFTVGQEKEICPNLLLLGKKFPYARQVVDYLTYRHRRNSILGGGIDLDDEDEEPNKGYLAHVREDGRIPTPADTCGAATSRFKHRLVANIPRVTSLYGENMRAMFGVDKCFIQLGYDFDSLEARIESHWCWKYDETKEYCESLIKKKPFDCHTLLAEYITSLIGEYFDRTPAKSVKYACAYNAQPKRVAKAVGKPLNIGKIIFEAYWEKAFPLKSLKEMMAKYWETVGGKKFLLGIDGRKLPIRSKGNCVNTQFQSSGVICAKRAAVIHDRKLQKEGLTVDFFRDDWKNKSFVQALILYHDEAQLEVSRDQVKFKIFSTKEEAKAFKKQHPTWSDIGHSDKGYYVGWCRAGELAVEAVKESGEYYKLNIELTAGYMLGNNWATCH